MSVIKAISISSVLTLCSPFQAHMNEDQRCFVHGLTNHIFFEPILVEIIARDLTHTLQKEQNNLSRFKLYVKRRSTSGKTQNQIQEILNYQDDLKYLNQTCSLFLACV